jgi:repressor LexA
MIYFFLPRSAEKNMEGEMKLTAKQRLFLAYVSDYINDWGRAPSFEEICAHFGFRSYNTVTTYLKTLERKGYIRLPREKNRKRAIEVISPVETRRFEFPLLGRVAAGKPIEAVEGVDVIEIPPSMAGQGDHFVLQVKGDSMKEDGILDGDFVVVRKQPEAENGQTVVALIDNEATVKRYYKREDQVELRPAHEGMEPIFVKEDSFRIEGRVVGLVRHYK